MPSRPSQAVTRPTGRSATIGATIIDSYLRRVGNITSDKDSWKMTIHKRILIGDRVRHPPAEGFSWIDRRFLREFAARLSGDAVFLYFFLAAVSDKHGLSYYADRTVATRLRIGERAVASARDELIDADLVAYQPPLTQVLSLPTARLARARRHGEYRRQFGDASS